MLRPEQLQLEEPPRAAMDGEPGGCYGTVLEADFCGPVCELSVRLPGMDAGALLRVSSPGLQAPAVGARVRITVVGPAHVFAQ